MRRASGQFEIDDYKGKRLPTLRWEVRRRDGLLMGVFAIEDEAVGYCYGKVIAKARAQ